MASAFTSPSLVASPPVVSKLASSAKNEDKYVLVKASDLRAQARSAVACKDDFSDTASVSGELLTQPGDPFSKGYEKPPLLRSVPSVDVKTVGAPALARAGELLKAGSGIGRNGIFTMRMVVANQSTSAAATPGAAVYAIEPSISSEMATLSALFSEYRVKPKVWFKYLLGWNGGAPNLQQMVVAYDPVNGTPLSSTSQGLQCSQHQITGFGPAYTTPQCVTGNGCRTFAVTLLSGVVTNGSVTGLAAADQWQPISSTAGKFGYISFYVPNGPAGVTSTVQSQMLIDVEFRNRW
jgi:hypothetical protein